ncbi:TIGR04376 family protein [[Limnothrix rosea] IAM M-220]|uniref:TIGR04376 family protein n=1 Tax=[Limnothrix rosea] IAM M-220 TaxID=454133 RepID=UPI0009606626|nr:TIGR04376 family protein [[Limnothrix rosea] IAM M-220]OKH16948.1 TIGR04376 family protein [[Limnothrix rosea] IAM M-220]
MGLFSDVGRFFETRLEEFLKNHPHLELQAIAEQLGEQEREAMRLNRDLELQLEQIEQSLTQVAKDIQHWHKRGQQAEAGGRKDLAAAAKQREAMLLRDGNQLWGKMQGTKKRIEQAKSLLIQLQNKRQEVKAKMEELQASQQAQNNYDTSWENLTGDRPPTAASDPLESKFQQWEMDEQIRQMKQKMGK